MRWFSDGFHRMRLLELRYERLILLVLAVIATIIILSPPYLEQFETWMAGLGEYGYLGAFIVGAVSSLGITLPPAAAALFVLGGQLPAWAVAIVAATGSTVADLVMFKVAKRTLTKRFRSIARLSKWTHRFAPIIIGLVIASPIPDEVACGIVGAMRFDEREFTIMVWVVHFIVFFVVAGAGGILV
jgi:membrane protein YqaA with SNARE-associated domain